jgi:peroxiredoxin
MLLNEEIQATIKTLRDSLPEDLSALIEQGAGEISAFQIAENALKVGDRAPDFTLENYDGEERSLKQYLQDGPVVLTFYRGLWCPYCNLQIAAYNARLADIKNIGANLVAISPEGPEGIDVVQSSNIPQEAKDTISSTPAFDVLHDKKSELGKAYGLTFELPESHKELMNLMSVDIEKANDDDSYTFSDPATYIIDKDGIIKWAFVPNNYRKRAEVNTIIEQLNKI